MRYNNKSTTSTTSGGIGFTGLLTIAFIILKLCHVIEWSWWWVLSPLWISLALGIAILTVVIVIAIICNTIEDRKNSNRTFRKK
jgi:membrane protein YdbS with pleckstrin-like domain